MPEQRKPGNPVLTVLVVTPLVLAPLVLLGVYLGYYVGGLYGYSKTVLAVAFSLMGLLASMVVVWRVILRITTGTGSKVQSS
jgi:ABC-type molybdate transport system permease subunit